MLKALRAAPEQRYATADAFADDIRRSLAGQPVRARRGTARYRAGAFVRRHRAGVAATALVAAVLTASAGALAVQNRRVVRERDRSEATTDFLRELLAQADALSTGRGDVTVVDVTTLLGVDGLPFPAFSLDPEGLALTDDRRLVVVSEGDAVRGIAPFVREFALDGRQLRAFEVPGYYAPTATTGIRNNLAFESAGLTPSGKDVFTATENALRQDGPAATTTTGSPSRILRLDVRTGRLEAEYVYRVEPVRDAPVRN